MVVGQPFFWVFECWSFHLIGLHCSIPYSSPSHKKVIHITEERNRLVLEKWAIGNERPDQMQAEHVVKQKLVAARP
jgi:hypothetical protein